MRFKLGLQIAILLALGQAVLGGIGFLTRGIPWLGLPLLLVFIWWIVRIVRVMQGEIKGPGETLSRTQVLVTALLWQLPAIATLPFLGGDVVARFWQGALLPVAASLDYFWPGVAAAVMPWLWTAALAEAAFFAAAARTGRVAPKAVIPAPRAVVAAGRQPEEAVAAKAEEKPKQEVKDWVPARRLKDIKRTGKRIRK